MKFQSLLFTMLVAVLSFAQPTITSLSTYSANVGAAVTITGTGFSTTAANNVVYFGSAKATITGTPTTTSISVTVPAGSTYSPVSVTVGGLTCESRQSFAVKNTSLGSPTQSSAQFANPVNYTSSASTYSTYGPSTDKVIAVGDFNLDGKVDVVKAGPTSISVHKNTSTSGIIDANSFAAAQSFSTVDNNQTTSPNSIQVADIDNDGKLDIIAANIGYVSVFRNTSTSSTINFALTNLALTGHHIRLSDIDGDGKKDFILADSYFSSVRINRNTSTAGSITFEATTTTVSGGSGNRHFEVAYINNDNKPDILLPTEDQNTTVIIALNGSTSGSVSFATSTVVSGGYYGAYNIQVADLDNDGDNDLYTSKRFVNNASTSTLSITTEESTLLTGSLYWFAAGDYTGDGKVDMLATYRNSGTSIYPIQNNYTNGAFEGSFAKFFKSAAAGDPLICDIDGDNKLDFLISGHENAYFQVIKNNLVAPPISASPNSLSGFSTCQGTASSEQSTSISGTNLGSNNITVTAPTGYEVSLTSGSNFGSSVTLNQSGGSVAATNIYVRLSSTASAGNVTGNLVATDGTTPTNISLSGTVNALPILTTQPTTTAIVICHNSTPQSLTVATSASSPSYLWQQSANGTSNWTDATTATNYQSATMSPSHAEINYGVRYYRCIVTSNGCSTTSNASASYSIANFTQSTHPATTNQSLCLNGSATPLTVSVSNMGLPVTYTWQFKTTPSGSYSNVSNNSGTNTYTPSSTTAGTYYYRCYYTFCNGWSTASNASGEITIIPNNTSSSASSTPSICLNTSLTDITHTTTGATGIGAASSLPAGVTAAWANNTITITGTPTAAGTFNYTIPLSGGCGNINATGTITVNSPVITTQPTTTPIVICHNSTPQSLSVATSASSPSYLWQQSANGTTNWTDATTATNYQTATMSPSHAEINYGVRYYRCIVTSNGCSTTSNASASYSIANFTQSTHPSTTGETVCVNNSATPLTVSVSNMGLPVTYTWQYKTSPSGSYYNVTNNSGTNTYTPSSSTAGTYYYRCYYTFCNGWSTASNASGVITVADTYTWTGATSTDPTVASNWSPAAVPCSGANEVIPTGLTNYPAYANLTIASGTTLTVQSGGRLTVTGTLTNDGTLTIESGATFLQGTSLAGSGTYSVKQTVTGAGGATPTGRFWYMGLPINNLTRAAAFGAASGSNRLWSWSESGQVWSSQITDATTLTPTTGYVFRTGATSTTLNFSGTSLYSANASITGLTNSGGTFDGCHLMSNPYTAYLDWEAIVADAGTTNLASTYCVRSFNSTSSEMVYDTYNATGDVSVNPSGVAMTRYIAPMQSFWITVNPSTTGTLSMTKAMLTHQAGAVGLKDITSFPAFARLNLVSGNFYDQVVVYTDVNATAELENYDSKKFFLPNKAQVYCPVGNEKLVINALKQGKAQTSAPLTVELPSTQVYEFEMAESFVENGLVILEDKQEGIFQDMGVNPVYEFFGNSGVIADRFVLHFQLPNGTNNEGQAGIEDLTSGQIAVIANHNGAVTVALSADLTTSGDIQIFDEAGRLVAQKAITSAQTSLQLNNGMGVYFVRVQTPMKTEMKKVMVY